MKKEIQLIGLTGTNSAGKGEAAAYFQKKGYTYFSLSDLIREELLREGKDISRDNLIKKGNELREKSGPDILARMVMKRIKGKTVIDSIRNPAEVAFLRKQESFILLAIEAPAELRYERAKIRGRDESASSLHEFMAKEKEEMTSSEKGQQLHRCMEMADAIIINDKTIEEFHKKLEELL